MHSEIRFPAVSRSSYGRRESACLEGLPGASPNDEGLFLQVVLTGYVKAIKLSSVMLFEAYKETRTDLDSAATER
jgi:hypothetical protein